MKSSPIKTSFNAGEWSPLLSGHINLEKFQDSCLTVENMICLKQGPITRRGGTKFIKPVKNSAHNTVILPFDYSVNDALLVEAGDQYFRFYRDEGTITEASKNITNATQANPVVITSNSHGYTNGNEVYIDSVVGMTQLNGKFYTVANVTANTYELSGVNGTGYSAYTSGGKSYKVYELASPYLHTDLLDSDYKPMYQYAQSADVMFIAHGDYNFRALARTTDISWALNILEFNDGPYLDENTTTTTLTLSGTSGSVTVTASAITGINDDTGFQTTDVGRLIRFKDPANNWTWLKITAWTSTTVVTATIKGDNPSAGTATDNWRLGVYSATTGFPKVVSFFQDRILLAGCASYPDRFDLSRTGGYSATNLYFAPSDKDGTVTDDAGISRTLASAEVNAIQWASTDERGLLIGTAGGEWIVRASTNAEVITPSNVAASKVSSVGSTYIQSLGIESGTLFVQRARKKIHDVVYSLSSDQLKPRDLNIFAEHINTSGVAEIKYQQEPINCVWAKRTDGKLIGMTYYPDQNVWAFSRHVYGGTNSKVRSVAVIHNETYLDNTLYMVISRTINGSTKQYIEMQTRVFDADSMLKKEAIQVDSAILYNGSPTASVTGLEHLEGETVRVMIDGKSHPDLIVNNGSVTFANGRTASTAVIGLANKWKLKTQRFEAGAADGTAQGKIKRIHKLTIRLLNTLGLKYGPNENSELIEYTFNQGASYDEDVPLFSGDTDQLNFPSRYEKDGTVYLESDSVFPATILALMPQLVTQDG